MKKIYISFITIMATLLLSSCTSKYDDYNKTGVDDEEGDRDAYFLSTHFTSMETSIISLDPDQNEMAEQLLGGPYGGYFSNVKFWETTFSNYNPSDFWVQSLFNNVLKTPIISYKKILTMTTDPSLRAIAKVLKVMPLARLTDAYGPIPYSALMDDNQLVASYDSQDKVYEQMIADLDDAITVLTAHQSESVSQKVDLLYAGKVLNWVKLANSVKLRLAIRMSNVNPTFAKKVAEEVINHEIGPMNSNSDNANILVQSGQKNPYITGMLDYNGGGDSRASADLTTYMNGYHDPRISAFFEKATMSGHTDEYIGIRNGISVPKIEIGQSYSNISTAIISKNTYVLMTAAEVAFLKAEGALRGWSMGGAAKEFYEQGIRLSFEQWGVTGADNYIADGTSTVSAYIDPRGVDSYSGVPSTITIAWDNTGTNISSSNLERIITQKWIAIFPNGHESWAEFRRTGFPKLMPVKVNKSSVVSSTRMARRLPYPNSEYTGNGANVAQAITYLGGPDNMATDIWWAKKD